MPLLPVAMYGLEVSASGVPVPADPDFPATIRITMAAIDPDESVTAEGTRARATLKIIRQSGDAESEDDEENEEYMRALLAESESGDESSSDNEEVNGGPSDPAKSKKARREAALKQLVESVGATGSDEEMKDVTNAVNGKKKDPKGKAKATGENDESAEDSDGEDVEIEEFVLCTLDPEKNFQQPLDITISENEQVFFQVSGTHTVYLTGNYVVPDDEGQNHHHKVYDSEEEDEDYDLSPDEDELELDEESDELDGLDDPRITEVETDEEEAPKLVAKTENKAEKKGKNKRSADEINGHASLDDIMAKSIKPGADKAETKLSKKQLKKLKKNNGESLSAKTEEAKTPDTNGSKKVQFAKNLEQGPTASAEKPKAKTEIKTDTTSDIKTDAKTNGKPGLGLKTIGGIKIDDKKIGSGPACKKGDQVGMRYIGKLQDGKVFDANKSGKPFSFKLGGREVIKGWDIGVAGMSVGGERRMTIPPSSAYGSKAQPGIPANSTLVFDVKLLEIK